METTAIVGHPTAPTERWVSMSAVQSALLTAWNVVDFTPTPFTELTILAKNFI